MPLRYENLSGQIINAAIEVHRRLGPGFLESIYEHALVIELTSRGIDVQRQVEIEVFYNGQGVGLHRLDLLVADHFIVELKAVQRLDDVHLCVVRSYLKASNQEQGLLLNFARPILEIKRVFLHPASSSDSCLP